VYPSTALAQAIAESSDPPQVWVSGSAIGIYGDAGDQILDETAPPGETFLADVVQKWEAATETARAHTRVVLARTGIVLARDGALRPLGLATRFGFGARIGPGTQWWGWISLIDEVRALIHALEMDSIVGPVNLVAPQPVQANDITRTLAKVLHRPHALVLPSPLIRLAMAGADELLLNSQRVHPQTLLTTNFPFHHPDLQTAITATQ
jgi:uncharacterized protein (TIGR01777 family)